MSAIYRIFAVSALLFSYCLQADDTELYVADIGEENNIRPQVLIIFDNSGSMSTTELEAKEAFDPTHSYTSSTDIYWSRSGIPSLSSNQKISKSNNNCQASIDRLNNIGIYTGNARFWYQPSKIWYQLTSGYDKTIDCKEDSDNGDPINQDGKNGYPVNGKSGPYQDELNSLFGSDDAVTLYSANYIAWNQAPQNTRRSRLSIAQETITRLINGTPSVDFGVAVFNRNTNGSYDDGGKIISKVNSRGTTETNSLINQINGLTASTNTPLCETLYEVYRYYAGETVFLGNKDVTRSPVRDPDAQKNNIYQHPFKKCQERAYVIVMTDGVPTADTSANSSVYSLTKKGPIENSYLPTLAQWMNNSDMNSNLDGDQYITTFTVGFGEDVIKGAGKMLSETAVRGGGKYFPATDADALNSAFNETILSILNSSATLTSPAVANNSFDQTRSLDSLYFSMFLPSNKSTWKGNIKKLKIDSSGVIVDRNDKPAIASDGNIKEDASTFWGGEKDGNNVNQGGISAMLSTSTDPRKVLSNIGSSTTFDFALTDLTHANLISHYSDVNDSDHLATKLALASDKLEDTLKWLVGIDVDDNDADGLKTDFRNDIFADALHSKPLAVTYVENNKQVVRLLVGTNAGFLHMFTDHGDTVTENWAFMPEELIKRGVSLKEAADTNVHSYGMDLSPMVVRLSGQIYVVAGMRRGGKNYYILNITDPDSPQIVHRFGPDVTGLEALGQTWSKPVLGYVAQESGSNTVATPVLIFGGGYDADKDSCIPTSDDDENSIITCDDTEGYGIYVFNPVTRSVLWSAVGGSCGDDDIHCIRDSIPGNVTILDSDADGYTDRIYAGDTGGNVWRVDLVGTNTKEWKLTKLASLGGDTTLTDKRFFTEPIVARTYKDQPVTDAQGNITYNSTPYDGVLLGSGNRAAPASDTTAKNTFYNIHDYNILPMTFKKDEDKPAPRVNGDFYDVSNMSDNADQMVVEYKALTSKFGWQYNFTGTGEKSLGTASLLDGVVYFTSFVPNTVTEIECGVSDLGEGWLYSVGIHSGLNHFSETKKSIGSFVSDELTIHQGVNEKGESVIRFVGVGKGDEVVSKDDNGNDISVDSGASEAGSAKTPKIIYSYFEER